MVEETRSWGRSLVEGIAYPSAVLAVGVVFAAGVTPHLVERWDNSAPVPDVLGQTESQARAALAAAGFDYLAFEEVCSSSVGAGEVREVLVDNSAPVQDEASLVNMATHERGFSFDISKDTPLLVKIGNGTAC